MKTNSRLSEATSRKESQDDIHKQLAAFEKLLQHAMSRFSTDNLYQMLRVIARWVKVKVTEPKDISKQTTNKSSVKIRSINQLREIVDPLRAKRRTPDGVSDLDHAIKYHDLFVNDLLYLKDLRKYFSDEIYASLMRYHYDPAIVSTGQGQGGLVKGKAGVKVEDDDSGHGSQAEMDDIKNMTRSVSKRRKPKPVTKGPVTSPEQRYADAVKEMESILKKWSGLMTEEALDYNHFDPDSYYELMQFTDCSQFESILRLVPDIFVKCYKCIDLAKVWLKEANVVLKEFPTRQRTPSPLPAPAPTPAQPSLLEVPNREEQRKVAREFVRQIRSVESQIGSVEKSIEEDEQLLDSYSKEMDGLLCRDEHFSKVSSDYERLNSRLTIAAGDHQKSKAEQLSLAHKLQSTPRDTEAYRDMKGKLKKMDTEVSENHWKVKLLEFEKGVLNEDYAVEMELRPSFIRFIGDTKEKIQEMQAFIQAKKEEKLKLGKQLALMKTNTDRMRRIMRTYLGSASSTAGKPSRPEYGITVESPLSLTSSDSDTFVLSEYYHDGNDADDDSAGPYDLSPRQEGRTRRYSTEPDTRKQGSRDIRPRSFHSDSLTAKPSPWSQVSRIPQIKEVRKGPKASLKAKRVWENV